MGGMAGTAAAVTARNASDLTLPAQEEPEASSSLRGMRQTGIFKT